MRVNWKVRFKNRTWLASFLGVLITFVYQLLGLFEIVPAVSSDTLIQWCGVLLNILVAFGVLMDPTTAGVSDSQRALAYTEPHKDGE